MTEASPTLQELVERLRALKCTRHDSDAHCRLADCDVRYELAVVLIENLRLILRALEALGGAEKALKSITKEYENTDRLIPYWVKEACAALAQIKAVTK